MGPRPSRTVPRVVLISFSSPQPISTVKTMQSVSATMPMMPATITTMSRMSVRVERTSMSGGILSSPVRGGRRQSERNYTTLAGSSWRRRDVRATVPPPSTRSPS